MKLVSRNFLKNIIYTVDNMPTIPNQNSSRLLALDILRGITIAGMILVNNPGTWTSIYEPLEHAPWHGLTPTDLVFPFFMFIMGISTYLSLRKFDFQPTKPVVLKILRRAFTIIFIGLFLNWFGLTCRSLGAGESFGEAISHFDTLRFTGVLQRLGLAYGFASLIAVTVKYKHLPALIVTILIGYFLILVFGNGFEMSESNIISIIDRNILTDNHIYHDVNLEGVKIGLDPEGLLSTIPSIAHVLIGFMCGKLITDSVNNMQRIYKILLVGVILSFLGYIFQYAMPINKKIWSSTYVLITCGMGVSLLGILIWIIDVKKNVKWTSFFNVFGVNPLFIFVLSGILANILANTKFMYQNELISIKGFIYSQLLQPWAGDKFGSMLYAILFVTLCWSFGYILYKKKIYIKI